MKLLIAILFILLNFEASAYAETKSKSKSKDECTDEASALKAGVIASMGTYAAGGQTIDGDTSDSAPGGVSSQISASIKNVNDTKCETVVSNNSKCIKYSVSIAIKESKAAGKFSTKSTNTLRLNPGEKSTLSFSCQKALNYQIELLSGTGTKIGK